LKNNSFATNIQHYYVTKVVNDGKTKNFSRF
jgi:hypothetical protein